MIYPLIFLVQNYNITSSCKYKVIKSSNSTIDIPLSNNAMLQLIYLQNNTNLFLSFLLHFYNKNPFTIC